VDAIGNIICAGYTSSFGAGSSDFLLVKYDSAGFQIWYSTWGTTDTEFAYDLAINNTDGSIVCTGSQGPYGTTDLLTVQFTSSGQGPTIGGGGGIPGFEILSAIVTLSIIVLVLKRKRSLNP
jgi:UDP-N-acetylmuramoylalanine-D-glutamate ligase